MKSVKISKKWEFSGLTHLWQILSTAKRRIKQFWNSLKQPNPYLVRFSLLEAFVYDSEESKFSTESRFLSNWSQIWNILIILFHSFSLKPCVNRWFGKIRARSHDGKEFFSKSSEFKRHDEQTILTFWKNAWILQVSHIKNTEN